MSKESNFQAAEEWLEKSKEHKCIGFIAFAVNSFKMVVFDPPHLVWAGKAANLYKRFGILNKDWKEELAMGFNECFRVLEPYGVLIFKWAETQLKLKTVLALTDQKPLFGHRRGKTFWVAFMKFPTNTKEETL